MQEEQKDYSDESNLRYLQPFQQQDISENSLYDDQEVDSKDALEQEFEVQIPLCEEVEEADIIEKEELRSYEEIQKQQRQSNIMQIGRIRL